MSDLSHPKDKWDREADAYRERGYDYYYHDYVIGDSSTHVAECLHCGEVEFLPNAWANNTTVTTALAYHTFNCRNQAGKGASVPH